MSFIPFQTAASAVSFINQPAGVGEKLVIVSSDTGDTIAINLTGLVASTPTAEAVTLSTNSRIERQTTNTFQSPLTALTPASALTGYVSVFGQGTAASGSLTFGSVPSDGDTLAIGLVGYQQTYTFRTPAAFTITTVAVAALSQADYFDMAVAGTTNRFWFDIDGNGTGAPSNPGVLTEIDVTTGQSANDVATALEAGMESAITGYTCSVSTNVVLCVKNVLGASTQTFTDGTSSTGFTYDESGQLGEGTADSANQIRTGYDTDGTAATASDVALWTQYAINASGGTAGTHYGTATAANAYLSALASSAVVAITDRIACSRSLGWTNTSPASITTVNPVGGANGPLIASVTGSQSIAAAQSFDNADLADPTLLALFASTTDWIAVNGRPSTLRLAINNVGTAVQLKLQASDDGTNAYDISGTTALTGTVAGTAAAYTITGTSTLFLTELRVGDVIVISTYAYVVASIASDTSLAVSAPLVTSPSGTSATRQLPVQIARLDNNSQIIPVPPMEYVRLNFTANANTTDSKLHAGIIT